MRFEKLNMYPQLKAVTSISPTCPHESADIFSRIKTSTIYTCVSKAVDGCFGTLSKLVEGRDKLARTPGYQKKKKGS